MLTRNLLLCIFLIAFNSFAYAEVDDEPGIFENLFKGLQVGINYGNIGLGDFNKARLLLFELRSIIDDDRKRPQGVSIGYGSQKEGSNSSGRFRGKQQMFYIMYDYGYRVKLSRKLKPYAVLGLGYSYSRKSDHFQVGADGVALGKPESENTQGLIGYIGMRYKTKIARRKTHFDLRYYRGEIQGISAGVSFIL